MGGTRPADRPASAGRWAREASTDHSHGDGEGAVDAVLFTVQDPRTTRHRRVPTSYGPARAPENCETRGAHLPAGHPPTSCTSALGEFGASLTKRHPALALSRSATAPGDERVHVYSTTSA